MEINEIEENSPYCENCKACGEEGCCSPLKCFSKLVENEKCKHGKYYLMDVELALAFSDWVIEFTCGNDILTAEQVNRKYREMLDKIYYSKNRD